MRRRNWIAGATLLVALGCSTNSTSDDTTTRDPSSEPSDDVASDTPVDTTSETGDGDVGEATDQPPPLNPLEVQVIDALADLGLDAQRAELPANDASIWVDLGHGALLTVAAHPIVNPDPEQAIEPDRTIGGVPVQRRGPPGDPGPEGPTDRFECAGIRYQVAGNDPPGFADRDALLLDLIVALDCAGDPDPGAGR